MHVYVQKSISTTRPRSAASDSGLELNQRCVPVKSGAVPSTGSFERGPVGARSANFGAGRMPLSRLPTDLESSSPAARLAFGAWSAIAFSARTSSCAAIATAVTISTAPSARCTFSVRGSSRRPPSISTSSTIAEPAAYAAAMTSVRSVVPVVAPTEITAARIGPAHGV